MKKIVVVIIALVWGGVLEAKELDTIYANEKMNTALFFPEKIRQGIVGNSNFIFTFNREDGQTLGLLKATKGEDSNLLVITTDGNIYSYIISYAEKLDVLNHFIGLSERIGNEKRDKPSVTKAPVSAEGQLVVRKETTPETKGSALSNNCQKLLQLPERKNITKRKKGVSLGIKNMVYEKNLVYLQMEIKNTSGIDFEVDTLEIFKVNGNQNKKSSYQELQIKVLHIHNLPEIVKNGVAGRFIYVLPKFTFSDDEKLMIRLLESKGSRSLTLIRRL
ncbi:MAG: DUF4138 domain-containing protein [Bacteroidota bacterium]